MTGVLHYSASSTMYIVFGLSLGINLNGYIQTCVYIGCASAN